MNDYLLEHIESDNEGTKQDKILVCPADPHNITLIFNQSADAVYSRNRKGIEGPARGTLHPLCVFDGLYQGCLPRLNPC